MTDRTVLGIIYTNIHDEGLGVLTQKCTVASIPFGGRYRLVDFALSNMVNSGITDVGLVTRSNYHSLLDHIGSGREWDLARKIGGLSVFPPYSRSSSGIYRGSLEALGGIMGYIRDSVARYVLISDCDVIANIDLRRMLEFHKQSGTGLTLAYAHMPDPYGGGTVLKVSPEGRLLDATLADSGTPAARDVSINVSIFDKDLLLQTLNYAMAHNRYSFLRDVLQGDLGRRRCACWPFAGRAYHIANMDSFFNANMELLRREVRQELFNPGRPIYTKVRDQVPAKYGLKTCVHNSLIADGCIIDGDVKNSVIFRGVRIGRGASVSDSIIMQDTVIGDGAQLGYCIADKDVIIRDNRQLSGYRTFPLYIPKGQHI